LSAVAIELLYFAWVRERIGRPGETVDLPDAVSTVDALIDWLATRGGGYAAALANKDKLRAAIDQRFVPLGTPLGNAREIAIFPPVTGG
jgi:molybdopterin synthase sulfur carrier subunit